MKQKNNKKRGKLYYLNHKNLIIEIEQLGYVLSFKELLTSYLKVVLIGIVAAYLFKLPLYGYVAIAVASVLFVPRLLIISYKSLYEQRKFSDANLYLEKMLYFFKKSEKLYTSLHEALQVFPSGNVHNVIQSAITYLNSSDSKNVEEEALKIIENEFPNSRIKTLHTFMVNVETKGGNPSMGIDMLLEDRELWTTRVVALQQKKHVIKTNVIIALVLTFGLCLTILYIPLMISSMRNMDISGNILVQWSAITLIIFLLSFYAKVNKQLCANWLEIDLIGNADKVEKRYDSFMHIDMKKERTKSIMYAVVPAIITAVTFMLFDKKIILMVGGSIVLFFLNSYKLGYKIESKNIKKEIRKAFPTWLLNVALLMQNENVHMAIAISYQNAPAILRIAIKKMLQELDENPSSMVPFNQFLSEFDLSEVRECMNTLYSISEAAGGDAEDEFRQIITRVNKYMDKAELIKNEDKLAIMGTYISAPAIAGSLKLVIDMLVMLMTFIATSNNLV